MRVGRSILSATWVSNYLIKKKCAVSNKGITKLAMWQSATDGSNSLQLRNEIAYG
jgi:hypothetical protein